MRKLLLFLFLSATLSSFGQSWAAPGATWYYDFQYFSYTGFERIQKIGDTIINSRHYDKLQIYRAWYDQSNQTTGNYYVPQLEYTRADSGVVYYYRDSADYVLYNFNAQPGESWVLRNEFNQTPCDTASVVVDSVSTMIVNGDTLRVLYTSPLNWNGITFQYPPVVEKLGGLANLLPYTMCVTDLPQGYNLRCYSDSSGWIYHNPNWNYACDDMMSVEDPEQSEPFSIFHNQQTHTITLSGSQITDGSLIQVFDCRGQLLLEETSQTNGITEVNLTGVVGGIYFVTVTTKDFRGSNPFLIVGD